MLTSTYRRGGEPCLFAFGASLEGGALNVDLLFVREKLPERKYRLRGDSEHVVTLPAEYAGLKEPTYFVSATLPLEG